MTLDYLRLHYLADELKQPAQELHGFLKVEGSEEVYVSVEEREGRERKRENV